MSSAASSFEHPWPRTRDCHVRNSRACPIACSKRACVRRVRANPRAGRCGPPRGSGRGTLTPGGLGLSRARPPRRPQRRRRHGAGRRILLELDPSRASSGTRSLRSASASSGRLSRRRPSSRARRPRSYRLHSRLSKECPGLRGLPSTVSVEGRATSGRRARARPRRRRRPSSGGSRRDLRRRSGARAR